MVKDKAKRPDPFGYVLTLAARRYRSSMAVHLAEIGLFPGQDQVLRALAQKDGLTMGEISSLLAIRPPTASKMIARMAMQGLLERRNQDVDARIVTVFLSEEGRIRADSLDVIARKVEKDALGGLDAKEQRRLRKALKRVAKNLGKGQLSGIDVDKDDDAEDDEPAPLNGS